MHSRQRRSAENRELLPSSGNMSKQSLSFTETHCFNYGVKVPFVDKAEEKRNLLSLARRSLLMHSLSDDRLFISGHSKVLQWENFYVGPEK